MCVDVGVLSKRGQRGGREERREIGDSEWVIRTKSRGGRGEKRTEKRRTEGSSYGNQQGV